MHHGRVEALQLVDGMRGPTPGLPRQPLEQLGHAAVDVLLGRLQLAGHLRVPEPGRHAVEDLAVLLLGVAPAGQPGRDRRVDGGPAGGDLPDRAHQLLPLGHPLLQEVGETALPLPQEGERVGLVVVGREHDHSRPRVPGADLVSGVDPLELEVRRHLDVRDDHVGRQLLGQLDELRRVGGDAGNLDPVGRVEQRPHAFPDQHVVLAEDDPDVRYEAAVRRRIRAHTAFLPHDRMYHPAHAGASRLRRG